jgi:hypothetical protein
LVRQVAEKHHQVRGMMEVYEPHLKGKHYRELKFPSWTLAEER